MGYPANLIVMVVFVVMCVVALVMMIRKKNRDKAIKGKNKNDRINLP